MFRHERPQKGRWRQFSQVNMEVINSDSIAQDAYFLKMLDSFFKDVLFLENYVIKLNFLGCSEDRKRHREALGKYLDSVAGSTCKTCLVRKEKNMLRVFDCKDEGCHRVYRDAPKLTDFLCETCESEWQELKRMLEHLAVNFVHTPLLVRGLDYYCKTVFEFCSQDLGAQNAFCAGGRYELGKELGSKQEVPSIGAAMGTGRLLMLLEGVKDRLVMLEKPALQVVIPMGDEQKTLALLLADTLQRVGLCVDVLLDGGSMKSLMRRANKMGASHVCVLGEKEQLDGTVAVKNMMTGQDVVIKQTEVADFIKKS